MAQDACRDVALGAFDDLGVSKFRSSHLRLKNAGELKVLNTLNA